MKYKLGNEFEIALTCIPTSGYIWEALNIPEGIELLNTNTVLPKLGTIGGSAQKCFKFKSNIEGDFKLKFDLKRVWEDKPINSTSIDITIVE